jgi:molybdate transport system substrate-binding protein
MRPGPLVIVLTAMAMSAAAAAAEPVQLTFGPSGVLKDEIARGARADVFASANTEHPQALAGAKRSGPVVLFARNRLCALVRPGLAASSGTILDRMLDPTVKLGTSTPRNDPAGDYAWEVFRKADKVKPGAFAALEKKALQLVGGASPPAVPAGRSAYGMLMSEGKADIFLTYCTSAMDAQKEDAALQSVRLPDELAVAADYGLTVIAGAPASAYQLAMFILSAEGQRILGKHGFGAPLLQ